MLWGIGSRVSDASRFALPSRLCRRTANALMAVLRRRPRHWPMHDAPPALGAQAGHWRRSPVTRGGLSAAAEPPTAHPARERGTRRTHGGSPIDGEPLRAGHEQTHFGDTRSPRPPVGCPAAVEPFRRAHAGRAAGHESAGAAGRIAMRLEGWSSSGHHRLLKADSVPAEAGARFMCTKAKSRATDVTMPSKSIRSAPTILRSGRAAEGTG